VFFDQVDGFQAVLALADQGDFGEGFEEEGEFFAGGFFVVDDDGVDGHVGRDSIARGWRWWRIRSQKGLNAEGAEVGAQRALRKRREEEGLSYDAVEGALMGRFVVGITL